MWYRKFSFLTKHKDIRSSNRSILRRSSYPSFCGNVLYAMWIVCAKETDVPCFNVLKEQQQDCFKISYMGQFQTKEHLAQWRLTTRPFLSKLMNISPCAKTRSRKSCSDCQTKLPHVRFQCSLAQETRQCIEHHKNNLLMRETNTFLPPSQRGKKEHDIAVCFWKLHKNNLCHLKDELAMREHHILARQFQMINVSCRTPSEVQQSRDVGTSIEEARCSVPRASLTALDTRTRFVTICEDLQALTSHLVV